MPGLPAATAEHCGSACSWLCDVRRETPIGSTLAILASVVGVSMVQSSLGSLLDSMSFLGQSMEQVANVFGWVMLQFVITLLVNIFALVLAALSTSRTHACAWDWASERARSSMGCITCLTGRCAFEIAAVLVVYTFLVAWALGGVALVVSILLVQVALVCKGGQSVIDSASDLATKLEDFQTNHERIAPGWLEITFTGADLAKFCDASGDVGRSTLVLFLGCVLLTLSQFCMSANVYGNRGRMLHRRIGGTGEDGEGGCEGSEDSSDEDDEEETGELGSRSPQTTAATTTVAHSGTPARWISMSRRLALAGHSSNNTKTVMIYPTAQRS
mmetsp:Transcript_36919/g.96295  ORF Transcript_36919/g.96295 Transcript_36919/m.96295 type:complete len:330 (-) Transcript_36919:114-1103(-)